MKYVWSRNGLPVVGSSPPADGTPYAECDDDAHPNTVFRNPATGLAEAIPPSDDSRKRFDADAGAWVGGSTVYEQMADQAETLRLRRSEVQEGGVQLDGFGLVDTDSNTAAKMTSAVVSYNYGLLVGTIEWKFSYGFRTITQAQLEACAAKASQHVQDCFNAEKQVLQDINASDPMATDVVAEFDAALASIKAARLTQTLI